MQASAWLTGTPLHPALLISACRGILRLRKVLAHCLTEARSPRSTGSRWTLELATACTPSLAASAFFPGRQARTTVAPPAASAFAHSRPTPFDAPVIRYTLPRRSSPRERTTAAAEARREESAPMCACVCVWSTGRAGGSEALVGSRRRRGLPGLRCSLMASCLQSLHGFTGRDNDARSRSQPTELRFI